MHLVNPPTYVSVAQMRGFANDYDLTGYTDQQLSDKLCAASAAANSIMHRDLLAQEQTIRYIGDGTDKLDLGKALILYIKRAQIVVPGITGYSIPVNELLVDYQSGDAFEYAPLYFAGSGYRSMFPHGAPIDITMAWGYGATVAKAPAWSAVDSGMGTVPPGAYNVAVTARTFWGETPAAVQQYTTNVGQFVVTVTMGLGVYVYRVYVSPAANNTTLAQPCTAAVTAVTPGATAGMAPGTAWLLDSGTNAEIVTITGTPSGGIVPITATQFAHAAGVEMIPAPKLVNEAPVAAFGTDPITMTIATLNPANGLFPDNIPTTDTSAPVIPWGIKEAVRLLCLSAVYEQNNLANRGIYKFDSGPRSTAWRSTEGGAARGNPTLVEQAANLLNNFVYRGFM